MGNPEKQAEQRNKLPLVVRGIRVVRLTADEMNAAFNEALRRRKA
jgi:hypothetical protein